MISITTWLKLKRIAIVKIGESPKNSLIISVRTPEQTSISVFIIRQAESCPGHFPFSPLGLGLNVANPVNDSDSRLSQAIKQNRLFVGFPIRLSQLYSIGPSSSVRPCPFRLDGQNRSTARSVLSRRPSPDCAAAARPDSRPVHLLPSLRLRAAPRRPRTGCKSPRL
jgi:hypothetical protein